MVEILIIVIYLSFNALSLMNERCSKQKEESRISDVCEVCHSISTS